MNPRLDRLQSYPFQKLTTLLEGTPPKAGVTPIPLYIGEPKHPTPEFIKRVLTENLAGFASYPATVGTPELREAIAGWIQRRYGVKHIDPVTQVIPVNGSREALFAIAQAVVDTTRTLHPIVVCPNPFYQIYEGAAILANAAPAYLNNVSQRDYKFDWDSLPRMLWERVQLVYVCSPGNPTGHVMPMEEWKRLFELSDEYGFVIASDECYSEIYFDEENPPLGSLEAAQKLGRDGFPRLIAFSSLSKRSNVPGMRSGFVAGDAAILKQYLLYRTYQGCAMSPPIQAASIAAWADEAHVVENRRLYREKFDTALEILKPVLDVEKPDAAFYLWARTPMADPEFTRRLHQSQAVTVLPGSYLGREAHGINPGDRRVRIALVASTEECAEAARRIRDFASELKKR
ncbi:MAG TPA: succinyldiaminopimelate transaminase [Burkholderiales bacterium]|nr:succinyldiaminopimelate transaminase [Burkholderiales bacterium]